MSDPANYDPVPGCITPESGNVTAMSDFADDIDAELGEPSLPLGAHLNMPAVDNIDSASQMTECVGFADPGLPGLSGKIPPESGSPMEVSDFASDVDSESGGPSLPTGVHSDMTDFDDIDSASQMTECVGFGDPGLPGLSGKIPPESGSPMEVSDWASDVDSESGGPSLPTGVHSDITYVDDMDSVSQMTECVGFGDPGLSCSSGKIPRSPGM